MIIQLSYNGFVSYYIYLYRKYISVRNLLLTINDSTSSGESPTPSSYLETILKKNECSEIHPSDEDKNLFRDLFNEYYHTLLYYANMFLTDIESSRDIVQEVFSNFWLKRDSIKEKNAIKSFLYVSTRNKCIDILRHTKIKRENERMLSYFLDTSKKTEHLSDLEAEVTAAATLTIIHKAIEELPVKYKEVIQLTFYENLSVKEIASRLQLPYKTIHTKKSRAIELLKETLIKYNIFVLLLIINQFLR